MKRVPTVWIVEYETRFDDGRVVPYSFSLNALNGVNLHPAR